MEDIKILFECPQSRILLCPLSGHINYFRSEEKVPTKVTKCDVKTTSRGDIHSFESPGQSNQTYWIREKSQD